MVLGISFDSLFRSNAYSNVIWNKLKSMNTIFKLLSDSIWGRMETLLTSMRHQFPCWMWTKCREENPKLQQGTSSPTCLSWRSQWHTLWCWHRSTKQQQSGYRVWSTHSISSIRLHTNIALSAWCKLLVICHQANLTRSQVSVVLSALKCVRHNSQRTKSFLF